MWVPCPARASYFRVALRVRNLIIICGLPRYYYYFPDAPSQPTASASYVLIGVLVRGPTEHIPVSMLAERIGGSAYSAPGLAVRELDALRPRARFSQPLDLFHTRYSAVRLLTKRRMQKRIVYVTRLAAYPCGSSRTQW